MSPTKRNQLLHVGQLQRLESEEILGSIRRVASHYEVPVCFLALESDTDIHLKGRLGVYRNSVPNSKEQPSICWHWVNRPLPVIICNITNDERFLNDPLCTGPPHAKFYAGAPLMLQPDVCIGSLCIIDTKPWAKFSLKQSALLTEVAENIMGLYRQAELTLDIWTYTIGSLPSLSNEVCNETPSSSSNTADSLPDLSAEEFDPAAADTEDEGDESDEDPKKELKRRES